MRGRRRLCHRFRDAGRGLWEAYREEPNLRFHVWAAALALGTARALGVGGGPLLWLVGAVALVWVAELVNTAVERVLDLATAGRPHPLARQAKDVAAGAVVVAAAHALVAGWMVLVAPRGLRGAVEALWTFPAREPLAAALAAGAVAVTGLGGLLLGRRRQ